MWPDYAISFWEKVRKKSKKKQVLLWFCTFLIFSSVFTNLKGAKFPNKWCQAFMARWIRARFFCQRRKTFRFWPSSLVRCAFRSCSENMASDSDSDEDFVTYGTPLEPLEEGKVYSKTPILLSVCSGTRSHCLMSCKESGTFLASSSANGLLANSKVSAASTVPNFS